MAKRTICKEQKVRFVVKDPDTLLRRWTSATRRRRVVLEFSKDMLGDPELYEALRTAALTSSRWHFGSTAKYLLSLALEARPVTADSLDQAGLPRWPSPAGPRQLRAEA
jgi:hypothetical protein